VTKKRKRTTECEKDTEIRGKERKHGQKEGGGDTKTRRRTRAEGNGEQQPGVKRGRIARKRRGRQNEEEERREDEHNGQKPEGRPKKPSKTTAYMGAKTRKRRRGDHKKGTRSGPTKKDEENTKITADTTKQRGGNTHRNEGDVHGGSPPRRG
jgi:hypothetical protein